MSATFDTRKAVNKLERADFDDGKSDAIVEVMSDSRAGLAIRADLGHLATREDIANLRAELQRDMRHMFAGLVGFTIALIGIAKWLFG